jgi:hypothetical protein
MPPIALTTPQQTTVLNVGVAGIEILPGPNDAAPATWRVLYGPSDANGNVQGAPGSLQVAVLQPADVVVFFTTPGSVRLRAQAALQNNLANLAGPST